MDWNEAKALEIAQKVTWLLGIPHVYLKGSWMKVDCSVMDDEYVWGELEHDGTHWKMKLLTNFLSTEDAYKNNMRWGLRLNESAVGYLVARAITVSKKLTEDEKIDLVAARVLVKHKEAFDELAKL